MTEEARQVIGEIEQHINSLQSRYKLYRGAEFRALIQRRAQGEGPPTWVNILACFRLMNRSPDFDATRFIPLADGLQLVVVPANALALPAVLEQAIDKGQLTFGQLQNRIDVLVASPDDNEPKFEDPEFVSSGYFEWRYGEPFGGVVYFLNTGNPLGQLGLSRQSMEKLGFRTLETLLWHHVVNPGGEIPESPPLKHTTGIYAIIPNYHAQLEQVLVERATVRARVSVPRGVHLRDFRLVLEAYAPSLGRHGWGMHQPPRIWEGLRRREVSHEYSTPPAYVDARLYWNLGRNDVQSFVDERRGERAELVRYPQLSVRRHFDRDLRSIKKALTTTTHSLDLEWAVASLLALSGFQVDWIGYKGKMMEGDIDIVAYMPERKLILLGECSLRGMDMDRKIADLAERAEELAESLEGWKAKRVLFTTLGWAGIQPSQKEGAKELRIALATKESLANLLKAVRSAVPADVIWENLKSDSSQPPDPSQ